MIKKYPQPKAKPSEQDTRFVGIYISNEDIALQAQRSGAALAAPMAGHGLGFRSGAPLR